MEEMNFKKQKVNYESKSVEGVNEFLVKGEYLIPDTHPDVFNVLFIDVDPKITNTEAFTDKVFVEGEVTYNIIYTAKEDDKHDTYNISYSEKFNLYIETIDMKKENNYNVSVEIVNIKDSLLNERKVSVDCTLRFTAVSDETSELDIICDVDGQDDVQLLMKDFRVCEVVGTFSEELANETVVNVPLDKGEISKILVCDANMYKTECKVLDGKIVYNAYCKIKVLYESVNLDDLCYIEQDVYLTKEVEAENISENMLPMDNWDLTKFEYMVDEDESGESRIINVYITLKCNLKVLSNNTFSVIDDAYSKDSFINLVKNTYKMNEVCEYNNTDIIVKDNVTVEETPLSIVYCTGRCTVTNKKVIEGKVVVDGVIKGEVTYKTNDENKQLTSTSYEVPFTSSYENHNVRIDMNAVVRCNLESVEAFIEAKQIGIKAIVNVKTYVKSEIKKDVLVDMYKTQEETVEKNCSIIIYIAGDEDTLWSIAKKYCVPIDDICRINNITEEDPISGSKLIIPSKAVF